MFTIHEKGLKTFFLYILYPKKSHIQSKLKNNLEDFFGFLFSKEQKMHFLGGNERKICWKRKIHAFLAN